MNIWSNFLTSRDERTPNYKSNSWKTMKIGKLSKVVCRRSLIELKINNGRRISRR